MKMHTDSDVGGTAGNLQKGRWCEHKLSPAGQEEYNQDVYSALCGGKNGKILVQRRTPASKGMQGLEDTALQEDRT